MAKASQGASFTFILATAFASYSAMHPILLFPPLMVLLYDAKALKSKSTPNTTSFVVAHTLGFAAAIGALLAGSAFLTGSWDFLGATYGVRLLMPDLTPNVGLWWYFFIEMFDSFREFFLGVFWLHAASYMPGLTIRLHKQPLFVACTLTGVFAIFTPYPSIADAALYLSLVPMFRHLFPCKYAYLPVQATKLNDPSDALYLLGIREHLVHFLPRPSLLSSMGLRRIWQRQLLLCDYIGLEFGHVHHSGGLAICSIEGRTGRGKAGTAGQGGAPDMNEYPLDLYLGEKCKYDILSCSSSCFAQKMMKLVVWTLCVYTCLSPATEHAKYQGMLNFLTFNYSH